MKVLKNEEEVGKETAQEPKNVYETSRKPTPKEIEIAKINMLRNMEKEVEYLELLVRMQTAKKQLGILREEQENVIKMVVEKTLQIVDAGLRKKEVFEKLGIVEEVYENTIIPDQQ